MNRQYRPWRSRESPEMRSELEFRYWGRDKRMTTLSGSQDLILQSRVWVGQNWSLDTKFEPAVKGLGFRILSGSQDLILQSRVWVLHV